MRLAIADSGWLLPEPGVVCAPIHESWCGPRRASPPGALIWHYTDTPHGTARTMATRRMGSWDAARRHDPTVRKTSWHFSIEADGVIWQHLSTLVVAYHAGSGTASAIGGRPANSVSIGVELVGRGEVLELQRVSALALRDALEQRYRMGPAAVVGHSEIDPSRRRDPGPAWLGVLRGP